MISEAYATPPSLRLKPCDRCGGAGHLLSLPAYVMTDNIRQCTLVYIQCERCSQCISSDDVLGTDPDITERQKMLEVVSVWNQQEYVEEVGAGSRRYAQRYRQGASTGGTITPAVTS